MDDFEENKCELQPWNKQQRLQLVPLTFSVSFANTGVLSGKTTKHKEI